MYAMFGDRIGDNFVLDADNALMYVSQLHIRT